MPTVSFEQLGLWFVCALIALDIFLRIAAHQRETKAANEGTATVVRPQPLQVKQVVEFATKEDHGALAERLEAGLERERSARKTMHQEIATLQGDVKSIIKETGHQSETLRELKTDGKGTSTKVDTMIGEQRILNQQIQQLAISLQTKSKS